MKTLTIISMVLSSLGIFGGLTLMVEGDEDGFFALMVFGFYLAYTITIMKSKKEISND